MTALTVLVDFDNVDRSLVRAGPVPLAKSLVMAVSSSLFLKYSSVLVRLYGGWRQTGRLTTAAQRLVPAIRADSPTNMAITIAQQLINIRLTVELAQSPVASNLMFENTYVPDRSLRQFRSRPQQWNGCCSSTSCGMNQFSNASARSTCTVSGCGVTLNDIFVRNEQKMVDTMMVADLAYISLVERAADAVVVSSDTDMWPGVLLALGGGCAIHHVHTTSGWRTQGHLMRTLGARNSGLYSQTTI